MSAGNRELPFVTVVIPVLDDADRLRRCLDALARQSYPAHLRVTVVVDNGSSIDPASLFDPPPAGVRFARQPLPGSYAARNRGIELAREGALAFTDADCVPAEDWLERGVARVAGDPSVGIVGGRIDLAVADPRRPTAVELYETLTAFPQDRYLETYRFAATANLFTRTDVVERVGPFDPTLRSGGDYEWGGRVAAAGYRTVYAEDARVSHPARRDLPQLGAKIARVAGGVHGLLLRAGPWRRRLGVLTAFLPPFRMLALALDPTVPGAAARFRLLLVIVWAKYRRALELARLELGGEPRR